ncbi:MAG: hypothetical protein N2036_01020 [Bryobacteraceae bacterium]|nr:hypothetical protein [Bryobacteraceae bacterium]
MKVLTVPGKGPALKAGQDPAGTEQRFQELQMGIHRGRPAWIGKGRTEEARSIGRTFLAMPAEWIPFSPSAEAQVEETLHQFKFDSSQGEGNG